MMFNTTIATNANRFVCSTINSNNCVLKLVFYSWPDSKIERYFDRLRKRRGIRVRKLVVSRGGAYRGL